MLQEQTLGNAEQSLSVAHRRMFERLHRVVECPRAPIVISNLRCRRSNSLTVLGTHPSNCLAACHISLSGAEEPRHWEPFWILFESEGELPNQPKRTTGR